MVRIRFECIGMRFEATAPNGLLMSGTIVDDPAEFAFYKTLGLDVFDNSPEKGNAVVEVVKPVSEKPKRKNNDTTKK